MAPVAVAAARGMAYFFDGMAYFFAASERGFGGRKGGEWREEADRAGEKIEKRQGNGRKGPRVASSAGPRAFFVWAGSPSTPRAPGSAWVRRHQFWPEPAKNELLGARLGPFFGAGAAKSPGEGLLGARLEMP